MYGIDEIWSYLVGKSVSHKSLGKGEICDIDDDTITIQFEHGRKQFRRESFVDFFRVEGSPQEAKIITAAIRQNRIVSSDHAITLEKVENIIGDSTTFFFESTSRDSYAVKCNAFPSSIHGIEPAINGGNLSVDFTTGLISIVFAIVFLVDENPVRDGEGKEDKYIALSDYLHLTQEVAAPFIPDFDGVVFTAGISSYDEESRLKTYLQKNKISGSEEFSVDDLIGVVFSATVSEPSDLFRLESYLSMFMGGASWLIESFAVSYEPSSISEQSQELLTYQDMVVIYNRRKCPRLGHDLEPVQGYVRIIRNDGFSIVKEFPAFFCAECGHYFMHNHEFERLSRLGRIACRLVEETVYRKMWGLDQGLAIESVLRQCGYTVSQNEGLTDRQRWKILDFVVDEGILPLHKVRSHIGWLIRRNESITRNAEAIRKWEVDLDYLENEHHSNTRPVLVKSLKRKRYY